MKRRRSLLLPAAARTLRRDLLRWYRREKRDLPWRASRDPYRVWISEAMLQQTRVETVIGYYGRFLGRFPTIESLARARPDDVLAAWSGLGYYRRARSLQQAAIAIVERHGGGFPRTREGLLALPGVGPYTAGAIASIAFDESEPLVDGNVARLLSRVFALEGFPDSAEQREGLWSLAGDLVPRRGAGEWNQALMELGALVCTPREPSCSRCPIATRCRARTEGRVDELPKRAVRAASIPIEAVVLAVRDRGRWLLERRPSHGRMAGLWQLPTIEVPRPASRRRGERPAEPDRDERAHGTLFPVRAPSRLRTGETLCEIRHTITHHRIRAVVKCGILSTRKLPASLAWVSGRGLDALPLTGMTRKCLTAILAAAPHGSQGPAAPGSARPRSETSTRNRHNA